jgi:hypothetical protein
MSIAVNADKTCFAIDGWIHAPLIIGDEACLPVLHLLTKPPIIYMLVFSLRNYHSAGVHKYWAQGGRED